MQFFKKLAGISVLLSAAAVLYSGCSPKAGESVVARVGANDIPLKEYENLYLKSSGTREQAAASTMEERERDSKRDRAVQRKFSRVVLNGTRSQ
jgi:hypothetical protein